MCQPDQTDTDLLNALRKEDPIFFGTVAQKMHELSNSILPAPLPRGAVSFRVGRLIEFGELTEHVENNQIVYRVLG